MSLGRLATECTFREILDPGCFCSHFRELFLQLPLVLSSSCPGLDSGHEGLGGGARSARCWLAGRHGGLGGGGRHDGLGGGGRHDGLGGGDTGVSP